MSFIEREYAVAYATGKRDLIEDFKKNALGIEKEGQNYKIDSIRVNAWFNEQTKK